MLLAKASKAKILIYVKEEPKMNPNALRTTASHWYDGQASSSIVKTATL